MRRLRHEGIYRPPGGLRSVFALREGDVYYFYDSEYGTRLPPRFIVRRDGTITDWHGEPAGWALADLADTGETFGV